MATLFWSHDYNNYERKINVYKADQWLCQRLQRLFSRDRFFALNSWSSQTKKYFEFFIPTYLHSICIDSIHSEAVAFSFDTIHVGSLCILKATP
jgi:hypothetical protein